MDHLSGLNEQYIPKCPKCREETGTWRVYSKNIRPGGIGFLNVKKSTVEINGEFNFKRAIRDKRVSLKYCLDEMWIMKCSYCGYCATKEERQQAKSAILYNNRRFPEYAYKGSDIVRNDGKCFD